VTRLGDGLQSLRFLVWRLRAKEYLQLCVHADNFMSFAVEMSRRFEPIKPVLPVTRNFSLSMCSYVVCPKRGEPPRSALTIFMNSSNRG